MSVGGDAERFAMSKHGKKHLGRKKNTWPESLEPRPTITSSHDQPASPAHYRGPSFRGGCNWYHKVSVCYLDCPSKNISCQCVVVKLPPELRSILPVPSPVRRRNSSSNSGESRLLSSCDELTLALVAPHTFLYCETPKDLRDWRLYTGVDAIQKSGGLKLHERYVSDYFTCCGPRGVWGATSPHTGTYIHETSCPFQADFAVFILKQELTDQLKDVLTIPCIPSLDEALFSYALRSGNHYLLLIQRGPSGASETHRVLLKPPSSLSGNDLSIEDQMAAYHESSHLQYTCGHTISPSGAAVVYFDSDTPDNALVLCAMHLYSRRDDEVFTHCGISLPAIFHAIAGSRVCGMIPCLSLLVGACNQGHWTQRFYQDLQDCLHPRKDPEDKQRRYHWISRLLTVCDYLSRDEAQAVLRLEVADSPQIVLASLNLLSALLGCFEREIELEGVSRFHCQINRVFLRRASERFHSGLERLFQRLYRHLTLSQSSDTIITVCVECWLKMCTLVGHKSSAFYEVAKFTRVKVLRDSPRFRDSAHFQRLFGDLCLAFLTHTRMTAHEEVGSAETRARIEELEREKETLMSELDQLRQELTQLKSQKGSCSGVTGGHPHLLSPMTAAGAGGGDGGMMRMDSETSFWERDMHTLLAENQSLREALGAAFHTNHGLSNGLWTHFTRHLEERLQERLQESLSGQLDPLLSGEGATEGDRVEMVVREWSSWEDVTVNLFCEVTEELGHGQRIRQVLSQLETVPSLDEHRNSTAEVI